MAGWQHASRIECSIEKVFLLESCSALRAVTNVERRRRAVGLWVGVEVTFLIGRDDQCNL